MSTLHSCKSCGFPAEVITGGTSCWVSCMNPDCNQATDSFDLDEVVEAIDTWNARFGAEHNRAQVDARPVGFIEQWELDQLKNGCVARVFQTNDEPHDVAVFTHPEASAPGLSEANAIIAKYFANDPVNAVRAQAAITEILTRASAATEKE